MLILAIILANFVLKNAQFVLLLLIAANAKVAIFSLKILVLLIVQVATIKIRVVWCVLSAILLA